MEFFFEGTEMWENNIFATKDCKGSILAKGDAAEFPRVSGFGGSMCSTYLFFQVVS